MVEPAKLEISYSGNHSVDFQDDNNVRIDPYSLFLHAMKSPITKKKYSRRLEMFFDFIKISGENLEEQCLTFVNSGRNNINWVFTNILKFVLFYKERINKKEISGATLINYLKAIKLFCEMSDISINWKKITRGLSRGKRYASDRVPTIDEIRKIVEYPDRRIKPIVYTMCSSGIRLGAWDYLRWKHIIPIKNDKGEVIAGKIRVYADDEEEYFSFISEITTFKYSQLGKGDLYEAVFINDGLPVFTKYNKDTNSFESRDKIEETTRILVPPSYEECPYLRYEFENIEEINSINKFIDNNNIDLDYFYNKGFSIISKYNNQSIPKLRLVTIKVITSHFQDRFPTTEYDYLVGGNGSGKSSIAETFRAIAYKTVVMTDPSAPNLFRLLGFVEPVQCTIVLEEADKIDKITELMAVLKTGYSYFGTVPKINPYTLKQESFYSYCPKVIVSERSLNQTIAKGVNSRTFPINCIKGSTKYDIKEVLNPTNTGGPEKEMLLKELMEFRKLLLIYRLKHFKDPIPNLDIGVEGRDKELVKHSIQLFHGSNCLTEVIETLQHFLDLKNEKKESTIESILLQKVVAPLVKHEGPEVSSKRIWKDFKTEVPGMENEKNPNEYFTNDYGTVYRNTTLPAYLSDYFDGKVKHARDGNIWIFDRDVIESLAKEDNSRIKVTKVNRQENGEGVKAVNTPAEGGP